MHRAGGKQAKGCISHTAVKNSTEMYILNALYAHCMNTHKN